MATLIQRFIKGYRYLNEDLADPRTKDYLLIGSPWTILSILFLYLWIIFKLGPNFMASRKPFKLDRVVQLYNATQIVLCTYIFYKALQLGWFGEFSFVCEPIDYSHAPRAVEVTKVVWMYFLVKIFDLLDTLFFVLRKKESQISFLHVYHHTGMVFGCWATVKYLAGGHITFLGLVNSFVHIVMYSYYLAASFKIQRLWWKKHITQLQLLQFIVLLFHFSQLVWVKDCGFPRWTAAVLIPQNLFMITLFGDFYYKAYIAKPKKQSTEQNGVVTDVPNGKLKTQ